MFNRVNVIICIKKKKKKHFSKNKIKLWYFYHWKTMFNIFWKKKLANSMSQGPNLKRWLTRSKFELQQKDNETKNCGKNCVSCPYRLKASLYLFKRVNKTCLLKNSFNCKNTNTIYIIIFRGCKKEYTGKMGRLVKQRTNVYRKHLIQPQYQRLIVEEHLRSCGDGKFYMFPFFKIFQKNKSLRKSYWDCFIDKFLYSMKRLKSQNLLK